MATSKKSRLSRPAFAERCDLYDPCRDMSKVEQFGFVNLHDAFEKGIIPSTIQEEDVSYNGVSDPGTLISHAQDVFDGLRKAEYVRRTLQNLDLNKTDQEHVESSVERSVAQSGVS